MCLYIYIYIYTCTRTYVYIHIYIYVCVYLYAPEYCYPMKRQVSLPDMFGTHPEVLLEEKNKKRAGAALDSIASFKYSGLRV